MNVEADTEVKSSVAMMNEALTRQANAQIGQINSAQALNIIRAEREGIQKFMDRINARQMEWLFGPGHQMPNGQQKLSYLMKEFSLSENAARLLLNLFVDGGEADTDWLRKAEERRRAIKGGAFTIL